ncbi:SDR family oxidoreductase [Natronolimnohabitans sp. A-GB9]|uniref:SDR family oxidoreductase n=1 Tax=Natronolimnohabitans sp. A-GB9 TaxID=3069757 RepID=UPI0027B03513|nr:SDR family oxidoreductase [Natronolimnohabitans sp. A-GB9]MDQ2052459.1 SDR family oxidoreductase [Natronolimnohabitans sp. A-GB9]
MTDPAYLVGGGGRGLGAATAWELASEGANVVVSDLGTAVDGSGSDPEPAREVAASIDDEIDGASAVAHFGDAADADDAADAIETTLEAFGRLDGVANFAGILRDGMSWTLSDEDWDEVVRTHLRSNFTLLRSAVGHWREADDPPTDRSFLAVSSKGALGNVGQLAYASANAGILGFVRAASTELHRQDVRVNALVPNGYTRMTESIPEEHRPYTREEMPPEDVAPAAAYLLSEAAADVTGVTVTAAGDEIGILSEPRQTRIGVAEDGWTVDSIDETFDSLTAGYETTRTDRFL